MEWLKQQGPWSPALVDYLERHHQQYDVLIFFTYLYAPTVLGHARRAVEEPARADGARRAGDPAGDLRGRVRERGRHRVEHRGRAPVRDRRASSCAPSSRTSSAAAWTCRRAKRSTDDEPSERRRRSTARELLAPHLEGPANAFRRRHRMHGPFLLYGGRIDPGKGCEELLEYFQTYVQDGGDATLMLMGVKLMPLPDDPHVRFAGMLPDEERLHALEAATVVVVPSPLREPVAAGARGVRRRHAGARQRASRSAGRALPAEQRGAVLRRPLGVRRGAEAAVRDDDLRGAMGTQRQGVRQPDTTAGASSCRSTSGCSRGCARR